MLHFHFNDNYEEMTQTQTRHDTVVVDFDVLGRSLARLSEEGVVRHERALLAALASEQKTTISTRSQTQFTNEFSQY